jgi:predicted GNAT superfamily acetyltransferase
MTVFEYKEMLDFSDYDILEDIQVDAWGMPARELVPKRLIYATLKSGGVVIGAYKDEEIIGYCWGWVGYNEIFGRFIYSHHNAVRKQFQNQGIGLNLKLAQRKWAMEKDFRLINWTFDPLQSKNCYLNLHKLGVVCNNYKQNYWGEMKDILNKGIDTDRFYCNWYLNSERVKGRVSGKSDDFTHLIQDKGYHVFETQLEREKLITKKTNLELVTEHIFIEIPSNFSYLISNEKPTLIQWRNETRRVFENYFKKGYKAVDFIVLKNTEEIKCYHVLKKEEN